MSCKYGKDTKLKIPATSLDVLRLIDIGRHDPAGLLAQYGLHLHDVPDHAPIPGSYWGDDEAGIIGCNVYARADTPIHSLLHEACHLIVMPAARRADIHTRASDSIEEENASCYLQIVLGDTLPGVGRKRLMHDMDQWGYSFRLGCTQAWFERDADDTRQWLARRNLLDHAGQPVFTESTLTI